jgi:ABC-type uncharacterized transport system ATPase subunit
VSEVMPGWRYEPAAGDGADGGTAGVEALLAVDDLNVTFPTEDGDLYAVRGVSYDVKAGEVFGIVGASRGRANRCRRWR